MAELHELGVRAAAAAIGRREISSVELVRALLARIEATEPRVQAWETVDAEGALAQAERCDAAAADGGGGALNGVPVGIKDVYHVAGLPTTAGWRGLLHTTPTRDAEPVARLRAAGAVILGKTVSTPFAMSDPPRTHNPWKLDRTPGGSSSGSAAAVAARQVPAGMGTQTAGSILRPAGYCGVVGLKATFGRVSRRGIVPVAWSLDHAGPITRDVGDAATMLAALAGHDPADQGSRARPVDDYLAAVASPAAPRLGLVTDLLERAEPEVRAQAEQVAARLERAGATVRPVRLPEPFERLVALQLVVMQCEAAAGHAALHAAHAADYPPRLRAIVETGQVIPAAAYLRAQRLRHRARLSVRELPALSLPSGLSAEGLPFATQLVAAPWRETTLLAAARWCEQELGPIGA